MKAFLAGALVSIAACGGGADAELAPAEYAEVMNDAFFAYDQQLLAALSVAESNAPGALDAGVKAMADQTEIYATTVAGFAAPDTVAQQHDRYQRGLETIAGVLADAAERFADPDSFSDEDAAAFDDRIEAEGATLSAACTELTSATLDQGHSLRLECERWG